MIKLPIKTNKMFKNFKFVPFEFEDFVPDILLNYY